MTRTILLLALTTSLATTVVVVEACNANVKEGCATAQCDFGTGGAASSSAVTTGSGGGGGAGGTCIPSGAGGMACSPPPPDVGDYPCEVFDVIHRRCHICHQGYDPATGMMPQQKNGAPFPLLKFEDTHKMYGAFVIWQDMSRVIKSCESPHMPLKGFPQLTDDEYKTLRTWFDGCAQPVASGTGCKCPDGWVPTDGDAGAGCF